MWLNINGADRMIICNPEKDTLAEVIRRIGLTGTKIGCGTGQCGACSVILNGEVVRSCVRKIAKIPEYSMITTVEGIGQPGNLHPLQQAFIYHGSVQCGFCIPGFIVSSKALLDKNPDPTREEIRDWFTKHRNACRCTGYKQIVDAVISAAKVLRGELTMDDITYKLPEDGKIYGTNYPRPAALPKVTGLCDYGDDIGGKMPDGTLHLAVVMGRVSHGVIKGIDFAEAEKMPGVEKVITAADVPGTNQILSGINSPNSLTKGFDRPIICGEKVFRYGDVVAVVAADTRENARAAAKAVKVDIEELPAYLTYTEAVVPGAIQIHDHPNQFFTLSTIFGEEPRDIIDESAYKVDGSFYSTPEPHMVIEPDCGQAYIDEEGRVTVHSKSLAIHLNWMVIPAGLGLEREKFRVIENPTGASFGYCISSSMPALLAACTMALDAPVSLVLSYAEYMFHSGKRVACHSWGRMGCDENGMITGMEFEYGLDKGAYTEIPSQIFKLQNFPGFGYWIPNVRGIARMAVSNNCFGTAYRGSGTLQAYTMSEALVDMMAEEAGIDPFDFRYRNLAKPGDLMITRRPYKEYIFKDLLDAIKPYYDDAKERCKTESTAEKKRGVGVTMCSFNVASGGFDVCEIDLELNEENGITCYNAWEDQGQGADVGTLNVTHEAFRDTLNIDVSEIKLVMNDTALTPMTGPSGANRQHFMVSMATKNAADQLLEAMRKPDGTYRTHEEMKEEGIETRYRGVYKCAIDADAMGIDPDTAEGDSYPEYNYSAYVSEVEVDVATGKTTVLKMVCAYDIGTVGNPSVVDGQAYGSIMHSIGVALREQYIDNGKYDSMIKAGFTFANDMPDDVVLINVPSKRKIASYGGVGCCEGFQSATHVAVLNAINNAVGARIYEVPATPERVKAAMDAKAAGEEIKPSYYLGPDFYESLEEIYDKIEARAAQ
jgi:aldehyde oxidoreductase